MTHNRETGYITVGVDIQNDFCPGGSLAVPNGDEIIAPFNAILAETRALGGKVVLTRDWHPAQTTHFDEWPAHCVQGTVGAEFHPGLALGEEDIVLSKGMDADENAYSGFDGVSQHGITLEDIVETELAHHNNIVMRIGGLATDYCDLATVLDALQLKERVGKRMSVVVLADCMRAVNINPNDGHDALEKMKQAGAIFAETRQ